MGLSRERDAETPLSLILPRLYLGAQRDVTQERLASLGISYIVSVTRCSPEPSFLPRSRCLRVPIDDSLRADLLPWIPQALVFIDAAMSSGASVLVHCAAGISRSPALAVAYIMYSPGMDLDQAYRFVKERRPSISPNFNFLGQLQHFQRTLSQQQPDPHLPSAEEQGPHRDRDSAEEQGPHRDSAEEQGPHRDRPPQRPSHSQLSGTLDTFNLTLNQTQQQVHRPGEGPSVSPCEPVTPAVKPTTLQLPAASASLLEKRKSLTLRLTPLGSPASCSQQAKCSSTPQTFHSSELGTTRPPRHREQAPPPSKCSTSEMKEQGLLTPFSLTLNKLLGWGERILLGGLFVPPVKMGQPALPYRC
ncbi:dual specificity protein phosphatase 8 [Trematomus bernacchii]|uniref:dual specificity protein phosphatase 8 n=1 Tax=Trematomus bernacchii TaxID=40690 RepID=UPI00146BAEC1|nr:dual specificity protein phosphatase 8 [Trematomus bernacchii]